MRRSASGAHGEEGNLFYRIIRKNPKVQCFLLNTGGFGGQKIRIQVSASDNVGIERVDIFRDQVSNFFPVSRSYASTYFSEVLRITSAGRVGAGGFLSQRMESR